MKVDREKRMLLSFLPDYFSLRKYTFCYIRAKLAYFKLFPRLEACWTEAMP
jgi:hypothetical protein